MNRLGHRDWWAFMDGNIWQDDSRTPHESQTIYIMFRLRDGGKNGNAQLPERSWEPKSGWVWGEQLLSLEDILRRPNPIKKMNTLTWSGPDGVFGFTEQRRVAPEIGRLHEAKYSCCAIEPALRQLGYRLISKWYGKDVFGSPAYPLTHFT
jgi:hypothetical protein